jgi:hypothetical protein
MKNIFLQQKYGSPDSHEEKGAEPVWAFWESLILKVRKIRMNQK